MSRIERPSPAPAYPESVFGSLEADDGVFGSVTDRHGDRNYRPFNRGAKLRDTVLQPRVVPQKHTIWGARLADERIEATQVNMQPALAYRTTNGNSGNTSTLKEGTATTQVEGHVREEDGLDNPFRDLNLANYWRHPRNVSEFQDMPSAVHTLESDSLKQLADTTMEILEHESELGKTLGRLTRFLLGDDPLHKGDDLQTLFGKEELAEVTALAEEALCCNQIFHRKLFDARTKLLGAHRRKDGLLSNADIFPESDTHHN